MDINEIAAVFEKALDRLAGEIRLYPSQESLWEVDPGITNSGGTLSLHISGNLQHFIGAVLGETGYVRDRPAEFAQRDIPRDQILETISSAKAAVIKSLQTLSPEALNKPYPLEVSFGPPDMSILTALVILAGHLNYHLGQINYHRRLL